jgi:dolichyl-phosphate beta-glucosyltransferase
VDLSIVIPAYNEQTKIRDDIRDAADFIRDQGLAGEILVADDGSSDDTREQARGTAIPGPASLHVIPCSEHKGKGYAVRAGVAASSGQIVLCVDCGRCVPYATALPAMGWIRDKTCQVAVGSRRHAASRIIQGQPWHRRVSSRSLHRVLLLTFPELRDLPDTQCGFKVYSGPVCRELFAESIIDGFLFDVEILVRAMRKGYTVRQFPIEWTCDPDSRLSTGRALLPVLKDIARIRRAVSAHRTAHSS